MQGIDGKGKLSADPLLNQENQSRYQNGHNGNRRRKSMVRSVFSDILLIDFDREGSETLSDDKRRSKVRKGTHKDQ